MKKLMKILALVSLSVAVFSASQAKADANVQWPTFVVRSAGPQAKQIAFVVKTHNPVRFVLQEGAAHLQLTYCEEFKNGSTSCRIAKIERDLSKVYDGTQDESLQLTQVNGPRKHAPRI